MRSFVHLTHQSGCIAGNLMIKHRHNEFPSDLFTMMTGAGASVELFCTKKAKLSKLA